MKGDLIDTLTQYEPLAASQERQLFKQLYSQQTTREINQAKQAREKLILHNGRLVLAIARRCIHQRKRTVLLEACADGIEGLIEAIDHFDLNRGVRFATYASHIIRRFILDRQPYYLDPLLTLPQHVRSMIARLHRLEVRYEQQTGQKPTLTELVDRHNQRYALKIKLDLVRKWVAIARRSHSLPLDGWVKAIPQSADALADCDAQIDLDLMRFQIQQMIWDRTDLFDKREQQILRWRYFSPQKTQREIGQYFNISRQRVCEIEKAAVFKLKSLVRVYV